jgi:plastocyanin
VVNRIAIALSLVAALALAGAAVGAIAGHSATRAHKTTVRVTEREYSISLSPKSLPSGTVVLVVHNAGTLTHRLSVSGPGLSAHTTPAIAPGATRSLTVKVGGGTFQLWCPIASHASLGMKTTLTVHGAAAAPAPTPMPTTPGMTDPGYGGGDGY